MTGRAPFVALVTAQTLSLFGSRVSMIAIPWLVLSTTGSAMATGLVAFAEMAPYVLAKALGGPWIDRRGAREIAIALDLAGVLAIATIPLLQLFDALTLGTILPAVVLFGALRGPADAAKLALVPDVAESAGLRLERVTGVIGAIERLAGTIGAAAAGTLIAILGAAPALVLTAAGFAASALVVAIAIGRRPPVPEADEAAPALGYVAELAEGWHFLRRDVVLMGIVVMVATTNLLDQGYSTVLAPVWARDAGGGAALLGLLFGVFSGASILGSLFATGLAERLPRLPVYVIAYILTGLPRYAVLLLDVPAAAVLAVMAASGFAAGFINPILGAVIFERIPRALLGRVSSLHGALTWMLIPFGGLVAGAVVSGASLGAALAIFGLAYFLATMLPLVMPGFRTLGQRPDAAVQSGQPGSLRSGSS